MKTRLMILLLVLPELLFLSCSTLEKTATEKKTTISIQMGSNSGGITENTDMSVVPGAEAPEEATVDAFSGATKKLGFNAGVHLNHRLKKNQVETGLDYMYNHQTFNYFDKGNMYIGVRELNISQVMIPVTYNIGLFGKQLPKAEMQIKAGLIGQVNFIATSDTGILPDYSVIPVSAGPTLGFSVFPFCFNEGSKLGVYVDIYRGSQIYEDYYNQAGFEMPGSSFAKFGLKYQF